MSVLTARISHSRSEVRQKILDEARSLFAKKGYDGTSVDSIMKAVGMSKGAMYWHFPGKFEVYRAVMGEQVKALHDDFDLLYRTMENLSPVDSLIDIGQAMIDSFVENWEGQLLWIDLFTVAHRGDAQSKIMAREIFDNIFMGIPSKTEAFPNEKTFRIGESEKREWRSNIKIFFSGLLMVLGITITPDKAKKQWESHIRMLFEGRVADGSR